MAAGAGAFLTLIGGGVLAEVALFVLLHRGMRLNGKAAAVGVALLVMLVYVPWAILNWPGADVFAIHLAIYLTVAYALGMLGSRVGRGWHWAPALIFAFFTLVIATNVVFLGVAERGITGLFARLLPPPRNAEVVDSRFPGTVSRDYQEKEAQYNAYLRQVEAQQARGWQVRKGWQYRPVAGQPAVFVVAIGDRHGRPVTGAAVDGRFLRTSNSRDDVGFVMHEVAPGEYRVQLEMPLHGLWRLVLQIRRGEDLHEVGVLRDLPYVGGEDAPDRQRLDLYVPVGEGPWPVLVWIHGGGFLAAVRPELHQPVHQVPGEDVQFPLVVAHGDDVAHLLDDRPLGEFAQHRRGVEVDLGRRAATRAPGEPRVPADRCRERSLVGTTAGQYLHDRVAGREA